jgi:hypothetical protein
MTASVDLLLLYATLHGVDVREERLFCQYEQDGPGSHTGQAAIGAQRGPLERVTGIPITEDPWEALRAQMLRKLAARAGMDLLVLRSFGSVRVRE